MWKHTCATVRNMVYTLKCTSQLELLSLFVKYMTYYNSGNVEAKHEFWHDRFTYGVHTTMNMMNMMKYNTFQIFHPH